MVSVRLYKQHIMAGQRQRLSDTVDLPPEFVDKSASEAHNLAAQLLGLESNSFDLFYMGRIVDGVEPLCSRGVSSHSVLHALQRSKKPRGLTAFGIATTTSSSFGNTGSASLPALSVSLRHMSQLSHLLRRTASSLMMRQAVQRVQSGDMLDRVITAVAGLIDDPILIAVMHDLSLLAEWLNPPDTASTMLSHHPLLGIVSSHLATLINSEYRVSSRLTANNNTNNTSSATATLAPSRGENQQQQQQSSNTAASQSSYAIDASSEAEDYEEDNLANEDVDMNAQAGASSVSVSGGVSGGVGGMITQQQLASALASVAASNATTNDTTDGNNVENAVSQDVQHADESVTDRGDLITVQQVNSALQQAMQSLSDQNSTNVEDGRVMVSEESVSAILQLGITDNTTLIGQALTMCNGNVDLAVEYLYNMML